ncbi:hypothetical protein OG729_10145 [Streptomyces sp. NBC_00210]|uniref:hypothetical protein n=1 Tax=Streptomyces sp. NBC_00210 TaxID=2903636 RepID=UPI0032546291
MADAYRCSDCHSETRFSYDEKRGIDRIDVFHDSRCPASTGATSTLSDTIRAVQAAGGGPALVVPTALGRDDADRAQ